MKTDILGVQVDAVTFAAAKERFLRFLAEEGPHTVFTPNPEMILQATRDPAFMAILNGADLVVPDGIGVVLASRLNRVKIKERVAGYDLVLAVFETIQKTGATVYFLGAAPGVAEAARQRLIARYPGLRVVGVADGYFDEKRERLIIEEIIQKQPDILLVGMSMLKQEKWIDRHKSVLKTKVLMGVGGSFDGFSGAVPRAPAVVIRLGLEWLYRLARQPQRIGRQVFLPVFVFRVIWRKLTRKR